MMKITESIKEPRFLRSAFGRYLGMDGTRAFPDQHGVQTIPTRKPRVTQRSGVGPSKSLILAALFSAVLLSLTEAASDDRWGFASGDRRPNKKEVRNYHNLGNFGRFNRKTYSNEYNHGPIPGTRFYDPDHASKSKPTVRKQTGERKSENQYYAAKQGNECVSKKLLPPPMPSSTSQCHGELANEWNQFLEKTKRYLEKDIEREIPTGLFELEDVDLSPETQKRILGKYNDCLGGEVDAKCQFHENFRLVFHAVRGDEEYFETMKREGHPYPPNTDESEHQRYGCVVYCGYHINQRTFLDYGREELNGKKSQTLRFVVSAMFLQKDFEKIRSYDKFRSFGDGSYLVAEPYSTRYTQHWLGAHIDGIFPLWSCEMEWSEFKGIADAGHLPPCQCRSIENGAARPIRELLTNDAIARWRIPDMDPEEIWRAQTMNANELEHFRKIAKKNIFDIQTPLREMWKVARKYKVGAENEITHKDKKYWYDKLLNACRIVDRITTERGTPRRMFKQRAIHNQSPNIRSTSSSGSSCSYTGSDDETHENSTYSNGTSTEISVSSGALIDVSDDAPRKPEPKPKASAQREELERLLKEREDVRSNFKRKDTTDKTEYRRKVFGLNHRIYQLKHALS